jgi:TonB-linked SusC/RagA family outer membrane protein
MIAILIGQFGILLAEDASGSQQAVVRGKVVDAKGESLPGVTVLLKGTATGTITDIDGKYTLNVGNASNGTLVFSFVGYKTQELPVKGAGNTSIILQEEDLLLNDVVVVGYGTMKKKDLTGAVVSVKSKNMENENPKSVGDILRGNVPGLEVGFDVSAKGGGALEIRGDNGLKTGSSPLIILDGIIYNGDMANINPNDIETIDILKDASSAAIYGARSANGVLLITTKIGSDGGKPSVNANIKHSIEPIAQMATVRDHNQFMTWRQDVMKSMNYNNVSQKDKLYIYDNPNNLPIGVTLDMWRDGNQNDPTDIYLARLGLGAIEAANYKAGKYVDWGDYIFQVGSRQDYNLSISGKANAVKYYWSMGYEDNKGNLIGDRFNSVRSLFKLESNVTNWMTVGLNSSFSRRNEGYVPVDASQYTRNSPYGSRYMDDGVTLRLSSTDDPVGSKEPDYDSYFTNRRSVITALNNNLFTKIKLPYDINYELDFAPRLEFSEFMNHQSAQHQEWTKSGGFAERNRSSTAGWEMNHIIKFNKILKEIHRFDVTLLANAEQRKFWSERMTTQNFSPSDGLGYHNMGAGTSTSNVISSNDEYSTASALMARAFYSLKNKYMLTLSLRRDGYSAFGMNHPYGTFPSAALGWQFTDEKFLKNNILTYGKLRLSWGENGNRDIGIYDALSNMSTGKYPYQTTSGTVYENSQLYVSRMANYDLKWERTRSIDAGIDFGFKDNMFTGSIDVYKSSTLDLLVDRKMTNVSGFTSALSNMGQVDNLGLEFTLNAKIIDSKNLKWNGTLTFYTNRNKVVHLYGTMKDVLDEQGNVIGQVEDDDKNNGWFIGRSIDQIWDYRVKGVWQSSQATEALAYGQFPGDFHIDDFKPDGKYNDDDKQFLGRKQPKFRWSMRHNFNIFKDFDLSMMMYSVWGQMTTFNAAKNSDGFVERNNSYNTPYWTPENPINDFSRIRSQTGGVSFNVYREASFVRLDNISLGYNVPKKLLSKIEIADLKIIGSVRNVFCWAPYWPKNYWDPETLTRAPRSFSIGFNITL